MIDRNTIENMLDIVPTRAKACYTGQSILAYVDDPTFTWEEVSQWENETDVDLFCYSNSAQASVVQAFISAGWTTHNDIEEFKAERIRFFEPNRKFNLQTVSLGKQGYPDVNISWQKYVEDAIDCIKRFDMDYLMVSMDMRTRVFADLRPQEKRVAHVNPYHHRFDPVDVEPSYWYRQFERCPKGYSRGIDTRPVARQYKEWIEYTLSVGDKTMNSKTRQYQDKFMEDAIAPVLQAGFTQQQAEAMYHLFRGETNTWEAQKIKHEAMLSRIDTWLKAVDQD